MEPHHDTGFPTTLCRWIGEIVQSSPEAARLTLLELIVGALLASGGHVTQAILALTPRLGWQAYHWMLERGRFRLLGLISALCRIVRREIGERRCFVVIDGSLDNAEDTMFKVKGFMPSRSDAGCHRARSGQGQGAPSARGPAALLDLPCARRPAGGQIGTTG
jgi:hypothetical protein